MDALDRRIFSVVVYFLSVSEPCLDVLQLTSLILTVLYNIWQYNKEFINQPTNQTIDEVCHFLVLVISRYHSFYDTIGTLKWYK